MQTRKSGLGIGSLLVVCAVVGFAAQAEDYPTRSVKLITQGAAASGPDVVARIVAEHLGRLWGQQITVLNHPGAGGSVAARQAASATADGYTLYMPATSAFIVMPQMFPNLPFDLDRDFVPIGFVAEQPMVIAVAPSLGVNVLQDLIMLAKKQPGEILYAANARGTLPHLTAERFRSQSGIELTFVPYAGAAAGLQDLVGGRISMIVESLGPLLGAIQGGSLKAIAVASARRLPNLPDLPTVAETIPGFVATGWFPLLAPASASPSLPARMASGRGQNEESGLCGGDARSGGGFGEMTRRKREIVGLTNEQDFPHLVELAVPPGGFRGAFLEFDAFHQERRIPVRRGRSRHEAEQFYIRFCFADTATADAFRNHFGGECLTYAPEKPKPRTSATSSDAPAVTEIVGRRR